MKFAYFHFAKWTALLMGLVMLVVSGFSRSGLGFLIRAIGHQVLE